MGAVQLSNCILEEPYRQELLHKACWKYRFIGINLYSRNANCNVANCYSGLEEDGAVEGCCLKDIDDEWLSWIRRGRKRMTHRWGSQRQLVAKGIDKLMLDNTRCLLLAG